jgi:hypothetical protein
MSEERLQLITECLISIARSLDEINTNLKEISNGLTSIETSIGWLKKDD